MDELVDRIYECAFVPELWPCVLSDIAQLVSARGGAMITTSGSGGILRWTASESIREAMDEFVTGGWMIRSARLGVITATPHAGFVTPRATTAEEFVEDPANRHFFLPRGLGWPAATIISIPTGDRVAISVEREFADGLVGPATIRLLDNLRPHLARSGLLSARLQLERARAMGEALAGIGLPALVLDEASAVLAANGLAEALTDHILWRSRDRVALRDAAAQALLTNAMATLRAKTCHQVRSFPVRGADAAAAMVAHVIPLTGTARDLVVRCAAILVLTPITLPDAPPVELIQSLFDLSPAEARVARHLAAGSTVGEIASADSVSSNTVRTQVRGILEKTGCRRQTEMVALLGGIAIPRT